MEHVSQFNQRMAVHSKNEALMCKVFPSSLGPTAMRWFKGLKADSVDWYRQLTQAFGSHFVTNSRAPQPLSALLSLSMRDGETLKTWVDIGRCIMRWTPFGLKNAGSTYQRMMTTRMFEPQLGKNIEIYVDDMVVKSKVASEHLEDLGGTFNVLRRHKLRLNAINDLKPPQNAKEV